MLILYGTDKVFAINCTGKLCFSVSLHRADNKSMVAYLLA